MTTAIQSGIYCIRNIHDGKRYIGQSANITKRRKQHFAALLKGKHHCIHLQRAFAARGQEAFVHEILEITAVEITGREQYWMDHFSSSGGIYNSAPAGGSPLGIKRSDETKAKCSKAKKGCKLSEETKQKMRDTHSKLREFHRVRAREQWSDESKRKEKSEQMKGKVTSNKTKSKLSEGLKNRWADASYKSRLSETQKIAQSALADISSCRMKEKWANPEFRSAMIESRKAARQQRVIS